MAVLYRKYRPQVFSDVLNQKHIIQTLKNQVVLDQVAHAYLFIGSRGVGKTTVARILAKAVNCQKSKIDGGDACGECEVCKQIERGIFLDLVEIDAASNTGVENIRDLIEHVKFSPSVGKYKVFIIDEVHMLSKGAFNALLKTLEEPPKHAIFILATTEINKVPATIISRTQRFDFKAYTNAELFPLLEKISKAEQINFSRAILELIAQSAQGSARDALSLLDKLSTLGSGASLEDCQQLLGVTDIALSQNLLEMIIKSNAGRIPQFIDALLEQGTDFNVFNRDLLEYLRKLLVFKITGAESKFSLQAEHLQILKTQAGSLSLSEIILLIRLFLKSYKDFSAAPGPQIPFLLAAVEGATRKKNSGSPEQISTVVAQPAQISKPEFEQTAKVMPPAAESLMENPDINLTLKDVRDSWGKVVYKLIEINASLGNLLRNSILEDVARGRIVVRVKFAFHKQNLEQTKNYTVICGVLKEIFGQPVGLRAVVLTGLNQPEASSNQVLADALKVFGGELIE